MPEASKINFTVSAGGTQSSSLKRTLTLDMLKNWIISQGLDEFTTKKLIDIANKYPANALIKFQKNFNLLVQRVRTQIKKENHVEESVEEEATIEKEIPTQEIKSIEEGINTPWL